MKFIQEVIQEVIQDVASLELDVDILLVKLPIEFKFYSFYAT